MFKVGVETTSLSLAAYYLRLMPPSLEKEMAVGTGFFYEYESYLYLITNGHNVTRVHPETNERITSSIAFPVRIEHKVRRLIMDPLPSMVTEVVYVDLYTDEDYQMPKWFVHPLHGYKVDVVAIPVCGVEEVPEAIKINPINKFDFEERFMLEVSDDVFILGYPFALTGGKELPIWKRGSIATEPGIDIDDLPKMLVDTATRKGMSGLPVIFRRTGIHTRSGGLADDTIFGTITGFVGIYSGRIGGEDEMQAQLGIVWKKTVIEEILAAKMISDTSFQNI
jgi:hypothetical protein